MDANKLSRRDFINLTASAVALTTVAASSSFAEQCNANLKKSASNACGYYPFKVGNINCTVISDGIINSKPDSFGPIPDVAADVKAKILESNFLNTNQTFGYQNTLYLETKSSKVLIDTGSNAAFGPQTGKLFENLKDAKISPNSIDAIFISHAHPDHINGLLAADGSLNFPNAEVFIYEQEYQFWTSGSSDLSKTRIPDEWKNNLIANSNKILKSLGKKLRTFKSKDKIIPEITALSAPGHTPGHTIFEIADSGENLFFTADICNHHILLVENASWSFAFDSDPQLSVKTRKTYFDQFSSDKSRLLSYHFPFPGIGRLSKNDGNFKWHQENWTWL